MEQVRYKAGQFVTYTATRSFNAVDRPGEGMLLIDRGEEVQFDGYILKYGGEDYKAANLKAAVKAAWLVPEGADTEETVTVAPRRPGSFGSGAATVDSDERIVLSQSERTAGVRTVNRQVGRHQIIVEGGDEGTIVASGGFKVKGGSARNAPPVDMSSLEAARELQALNFPKREGVQGVSQDEYLDRMDPAEREEYLEKLESRRAGIIANLPENERKKATRKKVAAPQAPEQQLREQTTYAGGIKFTTTGIDSKHIVKEAQAPAQERSETKIEKDGTLDARKKIAKALCSDFPDTYDFSQQWKKRLANIRFNFEDRPDVIQAIFAAESDDFKKVLLAEFPETFK